jgi:pimeloyl-ACP methyl ester carboxylesterase
VDFVERMMKRTSLEGMVGALIGMKERPDSTITLQDNYLPTLILQGEDDQILGREEAKYMDENLSHSHLTYLPDAGHLLNLEQPDLFNQEILRYMEELENREKNGE